MPVLPSHLPASVIANPPHAIVGIIRFSLLLHESNFFPPLSGQPYEERKARIFDPLRLRRRFDIFEQVCLPSLTGQSDPNFNVILATSRDLPDWAHQRLAGLVHSLPNIYVRAYRPQANIQRIYRRSALEMTDQAAPITATFRLDDDDALARGYVTRLRTHMQPENIGKTVTFSNGCQLVLSDRELQAWIDTRSNGSAGLALIQRGGIATIPEISTIYCLGGHRKVGQLAPQIDDPMPQSYVQTANGYNVTSRRGMGGSDVASAPDLASQLRANFPYLDAGTLAGLHEVFDD